MIIAEIACGTPPQRAKTLVHLALLQSCHQVTYAELMSFIEREALFGLGSGHVDLSILASTLITPGTRLWALDRRLAALAQRFDVRCAPT